MSVEFISASSVTPDNPQDNNEKADSGQKQQPKEPLPTERVAFDKQLQFLLAYAAASDNGREPVSNDEVAKIVEMKSSTVSLANNFFVKTGFLARAGRGYLPAREVLDFALAKQWESEDAAHKLAPILEKAWFAQALKPKLALRSLEESEAIGDLAHKAGAGPAYRTQLRMLLDYLEGGGLIRREGGQIMWNHKRPQPPQPTSEKPTPPEPVRQQREPVKSRQGAVHFSVDISVDMAELSTWSPERITAFFNGLAKALAAQKGDDTMD